MSSLPWLHVGQKTDSWFEVDSMSGKELHSYNGMDVAETCQASSSVLRIARTGVLPCDVCMLTILWGNIGRLIAGFHLEICAHHIVVVSLPYPPSPLSNIMSYVLQTFFSIHHHHL